MPKLQNTSILEKIARELGYSVKNIAKTKGSKTLLISNGSRFYIANSGPYGFYPNVHRWQSALMNNKIETNNLLKSLGYKTVPSHNFAVRNYDSLRTLQAAVSAKATRYPLLLKPNKSLRGRGIVVVNNERECKAAVRTLHEKTSDFMVQKILHHDEYRILFINDSVYSIQAKEYPSIIGDGATSISALLSPIGEKAKDASFIKQALASRDYTLKTKLTAGERFPYHVTRKNTQQHGNDDVLFEGQIPKSIQTWAKKLSRDIGCPIIGIDVFAPRELNSPKDYLIIELNANPGFDYFLNEFDNYTELKKMWQQILSHYFQSIA